jgi:hypothetical protein
MAGNESNQDKAEQSWEEHLEMMRSRIKGKPPSEEELREILKDKPPHRLELFFEHQQNMIVLRGNAEGFRYLQTIFEQMSSPETPVGKYFLFDEYTSLTKTNTRIMIKRVADID